MALYFITHCDVNFIEHVEKLFETLERFSNYKIIFYSIDFDYNNKHNHVINIRYDVDKSNNNLIDKKAYAVFLKPELCKHVYSLSFIKKEDVFCYIDADCLAIENCDYVFSKQNEIIDYPLLNDGCHDYMIMNNRGDPFVDGRVDYDLTLEAPLIKYLGYDVNNRKKYLQTGIFLFNYNCINFIELWRTTCFNQKILQRWEYYAPFHEETIINCLLWQKNNLKSLGQVLVNIPYYNSSDNDLIKTKNLLDKLKNPCNHDELIYTFTKIPSKNKIKNLYFLHGKHSQIVYDFISYNMSDLYLKIHSPSLGDTIAATPTLRKLSKTYNKKINVITHVKDVFANNPYVNNIYSFDEFEKLKLKIKKENTFETFLGCGVKNQYGVEKKHNTIDIRQFHAIDLGFMLLPDEMQYDYVADPYENINDLADEYVCLHVSETWESRTYKKENWQTLINDLNKNNIFVVLIGKNSHETGFYNIQKNVFNLQLKNGLDLTNKLNLSQSWHIINKAKIFVTMDSGPLHLAGTTDTFIIQLGSSINNKLRAPYRNNSQDYKYKYISGSCDVFCASDMKYGIKEWGNINGVPPLIKCLENKSTYECHPENKNIFEYIIQNFNFLPAKNKLKIGLLVTAYNCSNYIDDCLKPWMNIKHEYNIKIAVNSGMFSDYKNLGFPNRNEKTLQKLNKYNFDYFISTDNTNLLDEDSSRNKCLDYLLKEQKCDLIWILDGDEIYKQNEIENIIEYIKKNDFIYYNVTFKNYTFTKNYYSDFCPPRIFWANKNLGINSFYFDNHILYNDNSKSENHFNACIPKNIAHVDHYSWLAQDSRTQEKITYQNLRFSGEEGARCSFIWDEHYDCLKYNDKFYSKRNCPKSFEYEPPKYLFITPHLSTGGAPKYLEWLIKKIKAEENAQVKVIEWNLYSPTYTVQRNNIINLIKEKNFYSIGGYWENKDYFLNKENEILQLIKDFDPNYIHLNEFSEDFAIQGFTENILNFLYDKNRKFKLYETSHKAYIDFATKKYIPDELWLCSEYHTDKVAKYNLNYKLIEMELSEKNKSDRKQILESLNLDPNKLHVLQVGLFCKNKNQKYTFDIAKKLIDLPIQFHFVGNECYIDECDVDKNQLNCKIWGERKDVDLFMSCMDIFVMPSLEELNPISIKEALSWQMPCYISKIETLYDKYKNNKLINFIENNNFEKVLILKSEVYKNKMQTSEINKINISFNPKPKLEILGDDKCIYKVKFINNKNNYCYYETELQNNMWSEASIMYYVDWRIEVYNITRNLKKIYNLNLNNKIVHIICDSSSLGDNIAWMSSIDEFQKKHNCILHYYTNKKELFEKEYPNIKFYSYSDPTKDINSFVTYKIGCFDDYNKDLCAKDWRTINLCDIANEILGLEYKQIKPKITFDKNYKNNLKKYICIATQSTSQSRYWNKEKWEKVISYLKNKGYTVICVDKHFSFGTDKMMNYCPSNVDLFAGNESFDKIINLINNCEFFIGLSSGLSWLAWALNKDVLVISGSVEEYFEFKTPYRVVNRKVCNGCFNNLTYEFDKSNWMWCPANKNFECSENINYENVIEMINNIINPNLIKKNLNLFSFRQL